MHELALELNAVLDNHIIGRSLSGMGRRLYFPKGIVAQSGEAAARAHRHNATVGLARSGGEPMMLPSMKAALPAIAPGDAVAYSTTAGSAQLRDLWDTRLRRLNPRLTNLEISKPVVVPGLTNGLFQVASLFVNPGDGVVLPDLFWGNYRLLFQERFGAEIVTYPLFAGTSGFNVTGLENALAHISGKALVLLNFPNNPTGYSPRKEEVAAIRKVFLDRAESGRDTLVVSDDAYFTFFFDDDCEREAVFAHTADLHERILAIKVDGATKEEFAWGLRVGFVTVAARGTSEAVFSALEKKLMGAVRSSVSNSSTLGQTLVRKQLESDTYNKEHAELQELLAKRFAAVRHMLFDALPKHGAAGRLVPLPCNSGYFVAMSCSGISSERLRLALLDQGIGIIAVGDGLIRISFAGVDEEKIEELFTAIFDTAKSLKPSA